MFDDDNIALQSKYNRVAFSLSLSLKKQTRSPGAYTDI